mmetsp:Transcript_37179/g.90344  ORF Transcript_37179/g.90344 Transcript_37179/m.90344 type:complete len:193 (-) Transcript_37179:29-607(-)
MSLKINVQGQCARDRKHASMVSQYCKALKSVECGLSAAVQNKVSLTTRGPADDPKQIIGMLESDLRYVRNHVWNCVHKAFEIGKFDGYEWGQNAVKDTYKDLGCHSDGNIYSFATTLTEYGITIDVDDPKKCECEICWRCMSVETTKYEDMLLSKIQSAKNVATRVEREFDEERERKRRRTDANNNAFRGTP